MEVYVRITKEKFLKAIWHACGKNGVRHWDGEICFTMSNIDLGRPIAAHFRVFQKNLLGTKNRGIAGYLSKGDYNYIDVDIWLNPEALERSLKPSQIRYDVHGNIGPKNAKALRTVTFKAVSNAIRPYRRDL